MKVLWLLLALAVPSMATRHQTPDPKSQHYHQQVAASIQDLASGRRARDPGMSRVSTGRLIVEGVVENLRIYRLYRQEEAREKREKENDEQRRARRHSGRDGERESERKDNNHRNRESGRGDDRDGHRRKHHRSKDRGEQRHKRRHRHRSTKERDDTSAADHGDHEQQQSQRTRAAPQDKLSSSSAQHIMSGALHAAEALLDPDGTQFGSLPTKGKGVGLIPHAKTVYRHIKAEREAGHRSQGFAEKHVDAFLQKRRDARRVGKDEEESLLEKDRHDLSRESERDRRRRRRRGSRSREGERRSRRQEYPVYEPVRDGGSSAQRKRTPAPFARGPLPVSARPKRTHSPSFRSAPSVRDGRTEDAGGSQGTSHAPTIRIRSSTPPEPARSVRPLTPYHDMPSAGNMPVPVFSVAAPTHPPAPPPPPLPQPKVDSAHNAFLASIQGGVKLNNVREEDRKDKSAARKDDARIADGQREPPTYEGTPHSHEIQILEHAQAVEERERRQEEERTARNKTPLTAPQPRIKMPTNFQDELATTLGKPKLNERKDQGADSTGPIETSNSVKPRTSQETWRTVGSEYDERYHEPDRAFREHLGNTLSAGGTRRPLTAAGMPSRAPSRVESPAPHVFV